METNYKFEWGSCKVVQAEGEVGGVLRLMNHLGSVIVRND